MRSNSLLSTAFEIGRIRCSVGRNQQIVGNRSPIIVAECSLLDDVTAGADAGIGSIPECALHAVRVGNEHVAVICLRVGVFR